MNSNRHSLLYKQTGNGNLKDKLIKSCFHFKDNYTYFTVVWVKSVPNINLVNFIFKVEGTG